MGDQRCLAMLGRQGGLLPRIACWNNGVFCQKGAELVFWTLATFGVTQAACNGRFSSSLWLQSYTFFRIEVGRCGFNAVVRWSSPGPDEWEQLSGDVWFGVILVSA